MARRRTKWIVKKGRKAGKKATARINENNQILNKLTKN